MNPLIIKTAEGSLDLYENAHEDFYITFQINNIFSLNTREAAYSKVLNIPNSVVNKSLLNVHVNTANKNEYIECQIITDGVPVAYDASIYVVNITEDNIEISLLFGNFTFFTLVPELSIRALDFSALNFYWDVPTILGYFQTDKEILYAKASWFVQSEFSQNGLADGLNDFSTVQDILNAGFFFYCKDVFEKIVTTAGYTLDDTDVNTLEIWKNAVLPCPLTQFMRRTVAGTIYARVTLVPSPQSVQGATARVTYDPDIDDLGLWDDTNNEYDIKTEAVYNISCYYDGEFIGVTSGATRGYIAIYVNTSIVALHEFTGGGIIPITGTVTHTQLLAVNDKVWIEIYGKYQNPATQDTTTIDNSRFTISTDIETADRNIVVSDSLPNISQRTFLTSFMGLMNIFLDVDDLNKAVKLREFEQIADEEPADLSDKIDASKTSKGLMSIPNYYKKSKMRYNNADQLIRDDAQIIVNFPNDGLAEAGTILEIQFNALDTVYYQAQATVTLENYSSNVRALSGLNASIATNSFTFDENQDFFAGDYLQVGIAETKRIATKTSQTSGTIEGTWLNSYTSADFDLISLAPVEQPCQIGLADHVLSALMCICDGDFQDNTCDYTYEITFSDELVMNTIYEDSYKRLFSALQTPLIIQVWMNLTASELLELDYLKPVYIKQYSAYFYINKVEQWKVNKACRMTLVRINKITDDQLLIQDINGK